MRDAYYQVNKAIRQTTKGLDHEVKIERESNEVNCFKMQHLE
jgi:hypothetical protein